MSNSVATILKYIKSLPTSSLEDLVESNAIYFDDAETRELVLALLELIKRK